MVHTIHTRSVRRGRGRGRGLGARRTPLVLGPSRRSSSSHHSSTRHVSDHSGQSDSPTHTREPSLQESARQESSIQPSEEYTPRTPTREDMEETIETLEEENAELRERLNQTQLGNTRLRGWLHNLQQAHIEQGGALDTLVAENADLMDERHALIWDKVVLEQERRIAARPLGTRVRDRAHFYKKVTRDYADVVVGYFSKWVQCFKKGPKASVLWRFRPSSSFDEWVRDPYFPYYPSDQF